MPFTHAEEQLLGWIVLAAVALWLLGAIVVMLVDEHLERARGYTFDEPIPFDLVDAGPRPPARPRYLFVGPEPERPGRRVGFDDWRGR